MYKDTYSKIYRQNVKLWNPTAIDCYETGCNCSICFIYNTYFKPINEECKMKEYVNYLLTKLGKPRKNN